MEKDDRSQGDKGIEKKVVRFQKTLEKIVILLMEIKNESGISQTLKTDIGRGVEELQPIIRDLPTITSRQNVLKVVFKAIKTIWSLKRKISGD